MSLSVMTPESVVAEVNPSKDVPWFLPSINPRLMTPALVDLLSAYSGIPKEKQEAHLLAIASIRDKAWAIFPMPCIGLLSFLNLGLSTHPHYATLLALLKDPSTKFLDLGTCVGQDVRKLIHDGIPISQVFGSDLFPAYEDVGNALFKDEENMRGHFIPANFFDESPENELKKTESTWDAVNICMFLHGFSWDDQLLACRLVLRLLKPAKDSLIIGAQSGTAKAGESELKAPFLKEGVVRKMWRHNKESFREMWELAGKNEGVELNIWVDYELGKELGQKGVGKLGEGSKFFKEKAEAQKNIVFLIERL